MNLLSPSVVRRLSRWSMVCVATVSAGSLAAGSLAVKAADWTEFRGPTGQGIAAEAAVPRSWTAEENVVWRTEMVGEGWSSPVVVRDRIYLTSAVLPEKPENDNDRSLRALCFDARTGQQVWDREVFFQDGSETQRIHQKNSHASPTPIVEGDRLFVHYGTQGTACLDLDGNIVWQTRELKYTPQHGNGGSPVLFEDLLIVSCDGSDVQFVVALDKNTGKQRWKVNRPETPNPRKFSFSTPLVITVGGQPQLISPGTDVVVAYDPRNGQAIWQVDYDGYSVIPRPVYAHGLVFVSTSYNRPKLMAIDPTGSGNVTDTHVRWQTDKAAPHTPSVLVVGDELYFVSDRGIATCVDARSGEVHWTERLGGNFSASPVLAGGAIYFQSEQGETTVVKPGREFNELAVSELEERTLASLAVYEGSIVVRTDKYLYRFGK